MVSVPAIIVIGGKTNVGLGIAVGFHSLGINNSRGSFPVVASANSCIIGAMNDDSKSKIDIVRCTGVIGSHCYDCFSG